MPDGRKRYNQGRLILVVAAVFVWNVFILARLTQLQVFRHFEFTELAAKHQQVSRSVLVPRGVIFDCHMDELATSVTVSTVVAEPRFIPPAEIQTAASRLAAILDLNPTELESKMKDPARRSFMVVKRRIDPNAEAQVEALRINGIYLIEESMRVYPNRNLASHILGFVNMNGNGGAGLELQYDKYLMGTPGKISLDVDARRKSFRDEIEKPAVPGHALITSIDRSIQFIAERELRDGVEKMRAAAGVAAVMETDTGRMLALASYPDFNSNTYNEVDAENWRNRAVSDLYEPGSTFKVVVTTAALEAGLTRPDEVIDCQMGAITIGKHVFHDHKPYGLLTFNQILENSSNVGAAKLGLRLGEARLYDALKRFGFGAKTNIDLPGEIVGLVRDWRDWSALSIGAISFGQEVGVTSLQIMTAINAIANGGHLVHPSVVDRIISPQGDLVYKRPPEKTRIVKEQTAAAVRDAFEGVVLRGTGKQAALEGYRAAGKTGTAQKIIDGHYSNSKYLASFIGFAPLPKPKITVLVWIDEPKGGIYGGSVAAPVFQRITQEALLQLKVTPDQPIPVKRARPELASADTEDYRPDATPVSPSVEESKASSPAGTITEMVASESVVLPNFRGMAKRSVRDRCLELGLHLKAEGSGLAVFQSPPAGATIPSGGACTVTFTRNSSGNALKASDRGAITLNRNSAPHRPALGRP
jgi:cell division protein FtsI (penicillin-binding protein 3)